jgi:hypothetical protein
LKRAAFERARPAIEIFTPILPTLWPAEAAQRICIKLLHFHSQSLGRRYRWAVLGQIHADRAEDGVSSWSQSQSLHAKGANPSPDRCCIL